MQLTDFIRLRLEEESAFDANECNKKVKAFYLSMGLKE